MKAHIDFRIVWIGVVRVPARMVPAWFPHGSRMAGKWFQGSVASIGLFCRQIWRHLFRQRWRYLFQLYCGGVRIVFYVVPHERLFDLHLLAAPGGVGPDVDPPEIYLYYGMIIGIAMLYGQFSIVHSSIFNLWIGLIQRGALPAWSRSIAVV